MIQLPVVFIYPNLSIAHILCAVFPIFIAVVGQWKVTPSFPRGIPRVGGRKKISGGLRVRFRGWFSGRPSASALDEKIAIHVVSQFLTQNIDRIQSELAEELRRNIDQEFGKNRHNWQRVRLVEAMQRVMLGISR
jgi:hypothetical protein